MTTSLQQRMREILTRPEETPRSTLDALRDAGLVAPDSYETEAATLDGLAPAAPLVHLDPQTPHRKDGATGLSGVYSTDTYVNTEADPPYFRLPSFPEYSPYLIIYFYGRPASTQFTATLDLQVYSAGGSIRITATNNPNTTILSHAATGGARVRVPIIFTTTAEGFSSVFLQRVDQTGFDWMGADLQ